MRTTGDPNTPCQWASDLARALLGSSLLTRNGDAHSASLNGEPCSIEAMRRFLDAHLTLSSAQR